MPRFVSSDRLNNAISELAQWRTQVNSQMSAHLWQFLAIKRSGVNTNGWTRHEEAADQLFWDNVMKVRTGPEPYFDPLSKAFRIETHWHSNVATARKNTFKNRWNAAAVNPTNENEWRLNDGYIDKLLQKAWTRGGIITRVPVYSLCAWLYRGTEFVDGVELESVRRQFRDEYNITDEEYAALFQEVGLDGSQEDPTIFFADTKLDPGNIQRNLEKLVGVSKPGTQKGTHAPATLVRVEDGVTPEQISTLLVEGRGQLVLFGPPGTGKTFLAKAAVSNILNVPLESLSSVQIDPATLGQGQVPDELKKGAWSLIQFHPSYVYEDFVRGLAGSTDSEGRPIFSVRDRAFANLCTLAQEVDGFVVLIIDEINRGDLAKVLGELIYALEYRDEPVSLQYANESGSHLIVPRRLLLIATMNTADKSISHLDYAIRRRFDFIYSAPDRRVIEEFHAKGTIKAKALTLFDAVAQLMGENRDYAVGHSFFLHLDPTDLARAFTFQVLPLLAEYRAEGLIDIDYIAISDWGGDPVALSPSKPFSFAEELAAWLSESET